MMCTCDKFSETVAPQALQSYRILPVERTQTQDSRVSSLPGSPRLWASAQWRTSSRRRERLRRCGKGPWTTSKSLSPGTLITSRFGNLRWKQNRGKLVKFMRSWEGEAATVTAVCVYLGVCPISTLYYVPRYDGEVVTVMSDILN